MNKLTFLFLIFITGCSTHTQNIKSSVSLRTYGDDIRVSVTGNPEIKDKLERYLKGALIQKGFNIDGGETSTKLDVNVTAFSPGNAALRLTIGFGAGRGSLVYKAKYSKNGKVLVDYDGAERFTGIEIAPGTKYRPLGNFAGEDTATLILLEEATDHILDAGEL